MISSQDCFLDTANGIAVGDTTIGALIEAQGKEHLWEERAGAGIDTIVVHHISAVVDYPRDPYRSACVLLLFCTYGVSSHYLIDRGGSVYALVPESAKAWHCGPSIMPPPDNRRGVNEFSIGIELMGMEGESYTPSQYHTLAALCEDIEARRGPMRYVGHDMVAGERAVALGLRTIAKTDPGPLFDWKHFERLRSGMRTKN